MTKERATNTEIEARVQEACEMLAMKVPQSRISIRLAAKYKVTVQAARKYVREAKELLSTSFDQTDIRWLFLQTFECLQEDRHDAQDAGNQAAQVGASKAMVNLIKQIPNIDPAGCWDRDLDDYYAQECKEHIHNKLNPPKGKIPKERISKRHNNLDSLDGEFYISPKGRVTEEEFDTVAEQAIEEWKQEHIGDDQLTGEPLPDKDYIPF